MSDGRISGKSYAPNEYIVPIMGNMVSKVQQQQHRPYNIDGNKKQTQNPFKRSTTNKENTAHMCFVCLRAMESVFCYRRCTNVSQSQKSISFRFWLEFVALRMTVCYSTIHINWQIWWNFSFRLTHFSLFLLYSFICSFLRVYDGVRLFSCSWV